MIGTLIIGLVVGVIARLLVPGREAITSGALGWIITILLGIAGAFLGTFLGRMFFSNENYQAGWIMSVIGAIILLLIYRFIVSRTAT